MINNKHVKHIIIKCADPSVSFIIKFVVIGNRTIHECKFVIVSLIIFDK